MGVPEIAQVVEPMLKPAGRAGLTVQVVIFPPDLEGVRVVMAVLFFSITLAELKYRELGADSEPDSTKAM